MAENDNLLDSLGMDDIDTVNLNDGNTDYVPKFERDLQKLGSLEALSAAKKETSENGADTISSASTVGEELKAAEPVAAVDYGSLDLVAPSVDADALGEAASVTAEEPEPEIEIEVELDEASTTQNESSAVYGDVVYDNSYDKNVNPEELSGEDRLKALESSVDASSILLADMDYDESKNRSQTLKKQMELDDMALELGEKPKIDDMNEKYAPSKKNKEDLLSKDKLDRDEKRIIHERLESEIGKRPADYSKKKSLQMYHNLMHEQKVKKAKKGFLRVLLLIVLGIGTAALTYFKLNWEESQLFNYLSIATLAFSLLLFVKIKPVKVIGSIYYAANTIALIGPGFVKFAIKTGAQFDANWLIMFGAYVLAVAFSVNNCIQLSANEYVEAYYTTPLLHEEKRVFDDNKTKYQQ